MLRLPDPSSAGATHSLHAFGLLAGQLGKEASWHEPPHGPDAIDVVGRSGPPQSLGTERDPQAVEDSRQTLTPVSSRAMTRTTPPSPDDEPAAPFAPEPGFQWRRYPIARYTKIASSQTNPQKALIDWILRRTGITEWHGDKIAVLAANRTELRAYNSPEVLKQVDEVVERFTNATEDVLSVHVQFIAAVDTRWRYSVFSRLTFVGSGPQGQQIWTMRLEDAALVLSQMQVQQGFRKLADQRVEMINGQTLVDQDVRTANLCQRTSARRRGRGPASRPRPTSSKRASLSSSAPS